MGPSPRRDELADKRRQRAAIALQAAAEESDRRRDELDRLCAELDRRDLTALLAERKHPPERVDARCGRPL